MDVDAELGGELPVLGHLAAAIPGERASQAWWQRSEVVDDRSARRVRSVPVRQWDGVIVVMTAIDRAATAGGRFPITRSPSRRPTSARAAAAAAWAWIETICRTRPRPCECPMRRGVSRRAARSEPLE